MSNLEKKIDLLVALSLAESDVERLQLKSELAQVSAPTSECDSLPSRVEIDDLLTEIGVPHSILGYDRLKAALQLVIDDPDLINRMTKGLYPQVAAMVHSTASRVERNIRHGIESAWDRGDYDVLRKYFGNTISPSKGKPTNSEFLSQIAHYIRRNHGME